MYRLACTFLALATAAYPARADEESELNEAVLTVLGVKTDDASLITFVRGQTPEAISTIEINRLIGRFASPVFAEREEAISVLARGGPVVAERLRALPKSADPEVTARVSRVLATAYGAWPPKRATAYRTAVRVLARRAPTAAADCLLRTMPLVADDDLLGDVWQGLDRIAVITRAVPAPCAAASGDPEPTRRAVAAYLLGRRGTEGQRETAKQLLTDPDPAVRLRAAQGLLGRGDFTGVPALIALLDQRPVTVAWQAEELLTWLAGAGDPPDTVGDGKAAGKVRVAWAEWWARAGRGLDFAALMREPRRPSLFLLTLCPPQTTAGPSSLIGCDGRTRWQPAVPGDKVAVRQILPPGLVLGTASPSPPTRPTPRGPLGTALLEFEVGGGVVRQFDLDVSGISRVAVERWLCGLTLVAGSSRYGFIDARPPGSPGTVALQFPGRVPRRSDPLPEELVFDRDGLLWYRSGDPRLPNQGTISVVIPGLRQVLRDNVPSADWVRLSGEVHLPGGSVVRADTARSRLAEWDAYGRLVWETLSEAGRDVTLARVLPVLRLGFDDEGGQRLDLNAALDMRIAQLASPDRGQRLLAARAIRYEYGPRAAAAARALLKASGEEWARSLTNDREIGRRAPQLQMELSEAFTATKVDRTAVALRYLNDADPYVRVMARGQFVAVGHKAAGLDEAGWRAQVAAGVRDHDPLVRCLAYMDLLGAAYAEDTVPLVRAGLQDLGRFDPATDGVVAVQVARATGIYPKRARPLVEGLIDATKSRDNALASAACRSLSEFVRVDQSLAETVIPVLAAVAADPDRPVVRVQAAAWMTNLGPASRRALAHLLPLLRERSPPPGLRSTVFSAVTKLGPSASDAIPALIQALDRPADEQESKALIAAIAAVGPEARAAVGPLARWSEHTPHAALRGLATDVINNINR